MESPWGSRAEHPWALPELAEKAAPRPFPGPRSQPSHSANQVLPSRPCGVVKSDLDAVSSQDAGSLPSYYKIVAHKTLSIIMLLYKNAKND